MDDAALLSGSHGVVRPVRVRLPADQRLLRLGLWLALAVLGIGLVLPLGTLLLRAFEDRDGHFAGLANFIAYATTPALLASAWNSFWTAAVTTVLVVPLAFLYAYALTRAGIPLKGL